MIGEERIALRNVSGLARIATARVAGKLLREHRQPDLFGSPSDLRVILGFTGTRKGMTQSQLREVERAVEEVVRFTSKVSPLLPLVPIHGGCVGADVQFDAVCRSMELATKYYPGNIRKFRAPLPEVDALAPPMEPLSRDAKVVKESHLMIAAPPGKRQMLRSGTWATVRMSWRSSVPIVVIYPDGSGMLRE